MTLAADFEDRLRGARALVEGLMPDRRDPHRFHENRDAALRTLQELANEVELERVFGSHPARPGPARSAFANSRPVNKSGRTVAVEIRRARR